MADEVSIRLTTQGAAKVNQDLASIQSSFRSLKNSSDALSSGFNQLGNIAMLAGSTQLAALTGQMQVMTQVAKGLANTFSKIGFFRAGVIGAGLAGVALAAKGILGNIRDVEAEKKLREESAQAIGKQVIELNKLLNQRFLEGSLTKEQTQNLRQQLDVISEAANLGRGFMAPFLTEDLKKVSDAIRRVDARNNESFIAAHRAVAEARATAELEIQKARIAKEREENDIAFDEQRRQLDGYLARRRQLAIESNQVELKSIERQEFDARARLTTSDDVMRQKAVADLEKLGGQKKVLAIQLEQDLNAITADGEAERRRIRERNAERRLEFELKILDMQMQQRNAERAAISESFTMTSSEKDRAHLQILRDQRDIITDTIEKLAELRALAPKNPDGSTAFDQQIQALQGQAASTSAQIVGMENRADPNSVIQQWQVGITSLREQLGTLAQNISELFTGTIAGAINTISQGMTALIMGTQTWKQTLVQIGRSILTEVIQSVITLGLRWVATQIMMAVAGKAIAAASTAALIPIATAQSAILMTPAVLATIGSYGGAATAAPGFIAGALAMAKGIGAASSASGAAGFASGGYTGDGPSSQVAGPVHRGEFVFSAPAVQRIGLPNLEAMHEGSPSGGTVNVQGHSMRNTFVVPRDRADLREALKTSEGRVAMLDFMRSNRRELGIG